jgi:hypothetical protein
MLDHNYFDTLEEATVASIEMGVSAAYENYEGIQVRVRALLLPTCKERHAPLSIFHA